MRDFIKINEMDNVAVALKNLIKHTKHNGLLVIDNIQRGHKLAVCDIAKGEKVIKYGYPIGIATADIKAGQWVHSHNLATALNGKVDYHYSPNPQSPNEAFPETSFQGYLRADGRAGLRNELWIIPTVGCIDGQANQIARKLKESDLARFADDICVLSHPYGCSQLGHDHANTRAALAALACHPNAGGVLVLGLGCENNQISGILNEMKEKYDSKRVRFLVAQEVADEVATGVEICKDLLERMKDDKRVTLPLSKLVVGVKCGGSDGLSGITANPLVGRITDRLAQCGATVVLTEVPEMFGAEGLLMNRAFDILVFERIVRMINDFKDYFSASNQPLYENPSPGNKSGGITTLEEKSLGCVQKGGKSIITNVLAYAQRATTSGLNLLAAPGNDLVASTALAVSGCQIVLFTTGRGTPFGAVVPTLKISSNSELAHKKPQWIDFNAGSLIEGHSWEELTAALWEKVIAVASGSPTRNELNQSKELAIFKSGITL